MKVDQIKGAICRFFNNREGFENCPFIKAPSNKPAPAGNYIAVGLEAVQQEGRKFAPGPGAGAFSFSNVATLYLFEVEGDGDKLRRARNVMQTPDFTEMAEEAGFSVWEPSAIVKVDTFDGVDYVRQWRMTLTVNFIDADETTNFETIESVEGTLNDEPFEIHKHKEP